ncbi:hypothetical protein ACL02R_05875 [Streptomyces sp. MS19]
MTEQNEPSKEEIEAGQAEVEQAEDDVEGHGIREAQPVEAPFLDVNFGC